MGKNTMSVADAILMPKPRLPSSEGVRRPEILTVEEIETLCRVIQQSRNARRDEAAILTCYRHGLRASELVSLEWEQVDFYNRVIFVRRIGKGRPAIHTIEEDEYNRLMTLYQQRAGDSRFVFISTRGRPITAAGFAKMIKRAGVRANLPFTAHPHMLRHSCGYELAIRMDAGAVQDFLGHASQTHTRRYIGRLIASVQAISSPKMRQGLEFA